MSIDPNIAKNLSEKSDQDLIAIVANPADWMPPVVEFARSELGRRSISVDQINQMLAINAKHESEEFQQKSNQALTAWEITWTALAGVLGLLGLIFVIPQSSRFTSNGFLRKAKQSWRIYWLVFGIHAVCLLLYLFS